MTKIRLTSVIVTLFLLPGITAFSRMNISGLSAQAIGGETLSPIEKEIVEQINLARMDPYVFIKVLEDLRVHFKGNMLELPGEFSVETQEGVKALDDAISFLKKSRPTISMTVAKGLNKSAADHVKDQADNDTLSFQGTDGSSPLDRMNRYGNLKQFYGENIAYGALTAQGVVALFILSDGFPNRDLRTNLFNSKFKKMGVACGKHTAFKNYCVVDFAASYMDKTGK